MTSFNSLQTYQKKSNKLPKELLYCSSKLRGGWTILPVRILALKIFSFVCSWDSYDSNHSHQERGLEINIASFMYLRASCFPPLHYPPFFLLFPFPLRLHLVTFLKNCGTGVKLMWWKTTGVSLWAICHPLSPQRGSRLSVAIGGILQISQQLSEVTNQVHRWPHSLPSSPLLEPAPCPVLAQTLFQWCRAFFSLFAMFDILPETCMIHYNPFLCCTFTFLSQLNL